MFRPQTISAMPPKRRGRRGLAFVLCIALFVCLLTVPASALKVGDVNSITISNCTFGNPSFATYNVNGALVAVPDDNCIVKFQFDNQMAFSCVSNDPMGGNNSYYRTFLLEITLPYSADKQSLNFDVTCPYLEQTSSTTLPRAYFSTNVYNSYIRTESITGRVEKLSNGNLHYNIQDVVGGSTLSVAVSFISPTSWKVMQIYFENISISSVGNQEIIDNQDKNTQEIIDNQNDLYDKEKDETQQAGNDNQKDAQDAIPKVDGGFLNALKNLATSLGYNGTEAVLPIPALYIPAVADNAKIDLLEAQDYDMSQAISDYVPNNILNLLKYLLTIALILFCVYELYGLIQYVLTLKGGSKNE